MKVVIFVFVILELNPIAVFSLRCPNRWLERPDGDTCYRLWPSPLKTWEDARAACQAYDGDLLMLNSQDEKDWLIKEIKKFPASYEWWIGLNNRDDVNTWVWADGTPRNDSFISWGSGEPNNYRGEERCAEIWDSLLNDKNCRQPLQYICERRIDLPLRCDVDGGWDGLTPDNCYRLYDKMHTFEAARAVCNAEDASLLTNVDENKQKLLSDFLKGEGQEATWLGLKYEITHPSHGFDWQWQDGSVLSNNRWWHGGRPSDDSVKNESLNCVILNSTLSGYGNWQAVGCDGEARFICTKPSGTCPNLWQQHQSTCFLLDKHKTTWNEARGQCNLQGASLPEVTSSAFKTFIINLIKSSGVKATVWINWQGRASDLNQDVVVDDNLEDAQTGCVYLSSDLSSWQIGDCGTLRMVMCTVHVNTPVILPSDILPQYECPLSWIKRDNLCYIVRYDALTWLSARHECQQVGADLVVLNDKDTLDYLADLVNQEIWLGLTDRNTDEKYVWLDTNHEPSSTFWKKKEINSQTIGGRYLRNCVAMVNRQWITYPCNFKLGYVCQRRAEYNIAPGKRATQSSLYEVYPAEKAIEGCATRHFSGACCSHTKYEPNPWWEMDLGTTYDIGRIVIHRRYDGGCEVCKERLHNFRIFLSNESKTTDEKYMVFQDTRSKPPPEITIDLKSPVTARYVRIDIPDRTEYLSLCEVQVFQAKDIYSRLLSPTNSNCFTDSTTWNGTISHTVTGRKCQQWVKDTPHKHKYHIDDRYPEGSQTAAKSYCRDPDRDGTPWCYTLDPNKRWEYCGIPQCATAAETDNSTASDTVDQNCGVGWYEDQKSGKCYRFEQDLLSWSDAVSSCEAFGGTLMVTEDETERNFIKDRFLSEIIVLKSELIWQGIHDTIRDVRWKSIWKDMDITSLPLSQLKAPVKNTNCVAVKILEAWQKSFVVNDCANRSYYICKKAGKFLKLYTGEDQMMVSLKVKNILDIRKADSLKFGFKGKDAASVLLERKTETSKSLYEIAIGEYNDTKSIIQKNFETKYTSFEKKLISASEFRDFWLSWKNGHIKVGKGTDIDRNMFMEWSDESFDDLTDVLIHSSDGYWKFTVIAGLIAAVVFAEGFETGSDTTAGEFAFIHVNVFSDLKGTRFDFYLTSLTTTLFAKTDVVPPAELVNIATGKHVKQSSIFEVAENDAFKAIDGCKSTNWMNGCCSHTDNDYNPWWQVDLGKVTVLKEIVITRRWECEPCRPRMNGFRVFVTRTEETTDAVPVYTSTQDEPGPIIRIPLKKGTVGRFVKVDIPGRMEYLTLCEVEVFEDLDTDLPLCGSDWTIYPAGDKCFKFFDERRTWEQAKDKCLSIDGVLAPISSAEEQVFIYERIRTFSAVGLWFDTRRSSDKTLQLSNGTIVQYKDDLTFSGLWPGDRGDCFSLLLEWDYGNGMWVDFECSAGMAYVCTKSEKQITTTSSTLVTTTTTATTTTTVASVDNRGCPDGWLKNPDIHQCFLIVREFSDWFTARDKCEAKNGQLAVLETPDDQAYFKGMILTHHITTGDWDGLWIDGRDLQEGVWKLSSGEPISPSLIWFAGQPDDFGHNEDCLATLTSFERAGQLNDVTCSYSLQGYICQSELKSCESGWSYDELSGNCYKIFKDVKNWHDSDAACKVKNASLASISSVREQQFAAGLMVELIEMHVWGAWVGAHDIRTEGQWMWSDGNPWFPGIKWGKDQPDNWKGLEDCGMLRMWDEIGDLNDLECTFKLPYMCMEKATVKPPPADITTPTFTRTLLTKNFTTIISSTTITRPSTTSVTPSTTGLSSPTCGSGWEQDPHSKYCYQFNSDRKGFFDALKTCLDQDSSLVSIGSAAEQAYVSGKIASDPSFKCDFWLGITTDYPGWIDKSPLIYFNWAPGEPNNDITGAGALCQTPDSFLQWKIRSDKDQLCYICKRKRLSSPDTTTTIQPISTVLLDSGFYSCQGKGWLDYKSSCYLFRQEKVDWKNALKYCRTQGGDLASISSKDESDFIYSELPKGYCFNIWQNDTECNFWAESGECEKNPTWMARHCHKACNYCYHDCRDKYIPEKCMEWTRMGECDANPKWMHPNCAQSCGICYGAPTRGFWIGLTKQSHSQVYSWSDLSKPSFTLWAKRQPTAFASPKASCSAIFLQTGTWNDGFCTDVLSGFVCKKPKDIMSTTSMSPFKEGCLEEDSLGYNQYCYLYMKDAKSWKEALAVCMNKEGDLAAVTDRICPLTSNDQKYNIICTMDDVRGDQLGINHEDRTTKCFEPLQKLRARFIQAFLSSELFSRKVNHWIGLRDSTDASSIPSWSSGQPLTYTHFSKEMTDGMDVNTADTYKYQVVGLDMSGESSVVFEVKACSDANLLLMEHADNQDKGVYEIVIGGWNNTKSVIRTAKQQNPPAVSVTHTPLDCTVSKSFWISWDQGFVQVGSGMTVGTDRFLKFVYLLFAVNYIAVSTGFGSSGKWTFDVAFQKDCYAMSSSRPVGLWKPTPCNVKLPFICQTLRDGFTTPPQTTTPMPPVPCPVAWEPFEDNCYFASGDGMTDTWLNAEEKCKTYGGNLASIHSSSEADFLASLYTRFYDYDYGDNVYSVWIGINDIDLEDTFIWSDGSSLTYDNWGDSEPNNHNGEEHCGEMVLDTTEWNDNVCYLSKHYVCKIPRGFQIPNATTPVTTSKTDECGNDWLQYESYCYYHGNDDLKSWHDARQTCLGLGADLASIHNKEELYFLVPQVSKQSERIWLGLNDLNLDERFQWSDGTPADFFFWNDGEPNDYQGSEKCVIMFLNGRWNDLNCNKKKSFLCKRPVGGIPTTAVTTTNTAIGGCLKGFIPYGSLCYYISEATQVSWGDAEDKCKILGAGSKLVSIHSPIEQAFLTTQIVGKSDSYWIGLSDINEDNIFTWTDNSPVRYTNWDQFAPKQQYLYTTKYPCVAMENAKNTRPGVWDNYQCYLKKEFICVSSKLPNIPTPSPTLPPENDHCEKGYVSFRNSCYKLVSQKQTWFQARDTCMKENGDLVSIVDFYEQAFIEVLIKDSLETVWIGLLANYTGNIAWVDKSEVSIMLLEIDSMSGLAACGTVKGTSWMINDCLFMLRSICKYQKVGMETTSVMTSVNPVIQESFRYVCSDNYFSNNDTCYNLVTNDLQDFQSAQRACRDLNMTLASIHSKGENEYVQKILEEKVRNEIVQTLWIGLKKIQWKSAEKDHAYFLWTDESPVTFLDKTVSDGLAEDLNIQYGYLEYRHHWKLGGDSQKLGYICKGKPDVIQWLTTSTTTKAAPFRTTKWTLFSLPSRITPKLPPFHQPYKADNTESEARGLSPGQVAGTVIGALGFLFIISVIVYVIWKNWKPNWRYKMHTSLGFDNALFHKTNESVSLNE